MARSFRYAFFRSSFQHILPALVFAAAKPLSGLAKRHMRPERYAHYLPECLKNIGIKI
jgi:hypothetical protein